MSRDLQKTVKLLKEMSTVMDPEEDFLTIIALEEESAAAGLKKKKELEEAYTTLKSLTKTRDAARKSCVRPPTVPSAEEHATFVNEQDAARFQLAKAINEVESSQARAEAELSHLQEEAQVLEERDPALEHERELGGTTLRIWTYKGLGFQAVADNDGSPTRMLVRAQSGDVHSVDLTDGCSNYDRANDLWGLASS